MIIRPVELPLLRHEVLNSLKEEAAHDPLAGDPRGGFPQILQNDLVDGVPEGELFFVARDMADLTLAASKTLPSFTVEPEDVISPSGFMVFERPMSFFEGEGCSSLSAEITGVMWANGGGGVVAIAYLTGVGMRVRAHSLGFIMLGRDIERPDPEPPGGPGSNTAREMQGVLKTVWALMNQSIADESVPVPDRPARRRMKRAGVSERPVRVIELRRPRHSGPSGESDREYHHQWIVRGHWRQQWFPKREVHRPVWIAPHIKGPDGAPMLGGEKVHTWKR